MTNTFELTKIENTEMFREYISSFYDYEIQFNTMAEVVAKMGEIETFEYAQLFYEEYNLEVWAIDGEVIYVTEVL